MMTMMLRSMMIVLMMTMVMVVVDVGATATRNDAAAAAAAEKAALGVVERVYPAALKELVRFETISADPTTGYDVYELANGARNGTIVVRGNTAVAMVTGLNMFVGKEPMLRSQVSWLGDNTAALEGLTALPTLDGPVRVVANAKWTYHLNLCTHSYTQVWWDWQRWQRELDWAALHGVNLMLAFTGSEYVMRKLFLEFGLSSEEFANYSVGPAYLAWQRAGAIENWAGPLPVAWLEAQRQLQHKILDRMQELGISAVMPMFTGHIPGALRWRYPEARINHTSVWDEFSEEEYRGWYIEPTDPLSIRLGTRYMQMLVEEFGTSNHIYGGDQFLELLPASSNPEYLANVSRAAFETMTAVDPQAVWMLQAWIFFEKSSFWQPAQVKAYLGAVPNNGMLVLDLFAEYYPTWRLFEEFYGKPWIWCMLGTFGGNPGMFGNLTSTLTQPQIARLNAKHFAGIGLAMEATHTGNYIMYEAMSQMRWNSGMIEPKEWVLDFVQRRYGSTTPEAVSEGWELLRQEIYQPFRLEVAPLEWRPQLLTGTPKRVPRALVKAWEKMMTKEATKQLGKVATFRHDIVEISREVMSRLFTSMAYDFATAYKTKNASAVAMTGKTLLDIVDGVEELMATDEWNLLGKWLADARASAPMGSQDQFEENARMQVTIWGPRAPMNLNDYARRSWAGLYSSFYKTRWSLFVDAVTTSLASGKPFDQATFVKSCGAFEVNWAHQHNSAMFPAVPKGDPLAIAASLHVHFIPFLL